MLNEQALQKLEQEFSEAAELFRVYREAYPQIEQKLEEAKQAYNAKISEAVEIAEKYGLPFEYINGQKRERYYPKNKVLISIFNEDECDTLMDIAYVLEIPPPSRYTAGWYSSDIC